MTYFRRFLALDDLDFLIARARANTFFMTDRSLELNLTDINRAPTSSLSISIETAAEKSNE